MRTREQSLPATTRESPCKATKTQRNQKLIIFLIVQQTLNSKGSKNSIHSQCSLSFLFLNTYHQEFAVQPVSRVRL